MVLIFISDNLFLLSWQLLEELGTSLIHQYKPDSSVAPDQRVPVPLVSKCVFMVFSFLSASFSFILRFSDGFFRYQKVSESLVSFSTGNYGLEFRMSRFYLHFVCSSMCLMCNIEPAVEEPVLLHKT